MNDKNQAGGICESGEKRLLQNLGGFTAFPEQIAAVFQNIRQEKYLIHMIPNTVSASLCADGLAALGARPLMAVEPEEMEEIAAQADSCVVNLGQLNQEKTAAAEAVLSFAAKEGKPIVVDPVGCGASAFRLQAVRSLLQIPWKGIVKGNRAELYSIQQGKLTREGIDSLRDWRLTGEIRPGSIYLATGEPDCILWEKGRLEIPHKGRPNQNVVGSGCLAGAVAGACSSAVRRMKKERNPDLAQDESILQEQILAAAATSAGMAFALEHAGAEKGYGAAKSALLDGLGMLSDSCFSDWLKRRGL